MTKKKSARSPGEIDTHIGKVLKELRERENFSQAYLGECLGISFQQYQKYESGVNRLSAARLFDICTIYDCEPNFFFLDYNV